MKPAPGFYDVEWKCGDFPIVRGARLNGPKDRDGYLHFEAHEARDDGPLPVIYRAHVRDVILHPIDIAAEAGRTL